MFQTLIKKIKSGKITFILLLAVVALIVLPSGADDLFTIVPLIAWLGLDGYLWLALAVLILVLWYKDKIWRMIRC